MTPATPADRIEAKRIVAAIWATSEDRLGRLPSPSELARWARVYALAAIGLDAEAGKFWAPVEVVEEAPAPAAKPKAKRPKQKPAKVKSLPVAKSATAKRTRGDARLSGRRVLVPEQLTLDDAAPVSIVPAQEGPSMASPVVAPIVDASPEPRVTYGGRRVTIEVRA